MAHRQSIALLRSRRRFTQQELADLVGVSRGAVARIEIGTLQMSPRVAEGVARVLGLSVTDLIDYVDGKLSLEAAVSRMAPDTQSKYESEEEASINAAVTVNTLLVEGLKRTGATLEQLDVVRRWFNGMGPIVPVAHALDASPEAAAKIIDALFTEARTSDTPNTTSSLALLRVLSQQMRSH